MKEAGKTHQLGGQIGTDPNLAHATHTGHSRANARHTDPQPELKLTPAEQEIYDGKKGDILQKAIKIGGSPRDLQPHRLRLLARVRGYKEDSIDMLTMLKEHYDEKAKRTRSSGPDGPPHGEEIGIDDESHQNARKKIMSEAQKLALEYWRKLQKAPAQEKVAIEKDLDKVRDIYADLNPSKWYSKNSLRPYAPGDRFDHTTGTSVEPYGICKVCDKKDLTTILKGDYCHLCGAPASQK